ncbi:MAG: hypothetical protein ACW9WZ_06335 [Nitrosopumilus sp.]
MSDLIIEKLQEQRAVFLNSLKQLDFQLAIDPTEDEIIEIEKMKISTIEELKKIEQEIAYLSSKNSS